MDSHKSRRSEYSGCTTDSMASRLRPSWITRMQPSGRVRRRSVWLSALYLLVLAKGYGLDPSRRISQYGHALWRTQDGLVNATSLITQTTDGYLWTPTARGLARFDGVNFVPWTAPRDIPFLLRQFTALLGTSDGSLWIGTSHGLGRLKDGQFHSYSRPGDRWGVFSIIEDHTGHIWVGSNLRSSGSWTSLLWSGRWRSPPIRSWTGRRQSGELLDWIPASLSLETGIGLRDLLQRPGLR
jgi:hypothetical protein